MKSILLKEDEKPEPWEYPAWHQVAQLEMRLRAEMLETVQELRETIRKEIEDQSINAVEVADLNSREYVREAHEASASATPATMTTPATIEPRPDFLRVHQLVQFYGVAPIKTWRHWIFTDYRGLASRCVTRKGRNVLVNRLELERWIAERG
jgi:hypothetical protein